MTEQAIHRLTPEMDGAVQRINAAEYAFRVAGTTHGAALAALRRAVYEGLNAGVPASLIAERLEVSKSRVYQMRNEVREQLK